LNLQSKEPDPWSARSALQEAAALRPALDLRNVYARCLDLPGLRLVQTFTAPLDGPATVLPEHLPRSAWWLTGRASLLPDAPRLRTLIHGGPVEFDIRTGQVLATRDSPGEKN